MPHQVSSMRIEELTHLINKTCNEFKNRPFQEFVWALEIALSDSSLPESWQKAAMDKQLVAAYRKNFERDGRGLSSANLVHILHTHY